MANLIHVAAILGEKGEKKWVFLRKTEGNYFWVLDQDGGEVPTGVEAITSEEAIRLARHKWKEQGFSSLACGFQYTLPERDEHGTPALFHQMAQSLNSPSGVYFDEDRGHNCQVQLIPLETRRFYEKLRRENRL